MADNATGIAMRTLLSVAVALSIAFAAGIWSVVRALDTLAGIGDARVGNWLVAANAATSDADPYTRARAARTASLPLAPGEGLRLVASRDHDGNTLERACAYRIEGRFPATRFWSLHAVDRDGAPVATGNLRTGVMHSGMVLWAPGGTILIEVASRPAPGNWLATSGDGPFALVLNLYGGTTSGADSLNEANLPVIRKGACGG